MIYRPRKLNRRKTKKKNVNFIEAHSIWVLLEHDFSGFVIFFVAQSVALCDFYCVNQKVFMLLIKFIGIGSFIVAGCHRHKPRSHPKWCVHETKSSYNLALHQRIGRRKKQYSLHFSGLFDFRFKFASRR